MPNSSDSILRNWAHLGRSLKTQVVIVDARRTRSFIDSFSTLMSHGRSLRDVEFRELALVSSLSSARLKPLGEPLEHDLGVNRWLAGAREEAYSDWLAWLLSRMEPSELAFVLDLPEVCRLGLDASRDAIRVEREVWVDRGHEGRRGRLDIVLYLQDLYQRDRAIIALELKRGSADERVDTAKQKGYVESIRKKTTCSGMYTKYLLLVTTSKRDKVDDFDVRRYDILCLRLRKLAVKWISKDEYFLAAITLTVAASIETNLLHMSLQRSSFTPKTLSHLRNFMEGADYE